MIPRTIHQIWVGPEDPPTDWMQGWVDLAFESDFDYRVWTEATIPALENQDAYDYYIWHEDWAGASDIARVEILERFGGWYVDADCELIDPQGFYWDPMHQSEFVAVEHPAPQDHQEYKRFPNTVFASVPGHRILGRMINLQEKCFEDDNLEPPWATVGGTAFSMAINLVPKKHKPHFVEAKTFLPFHFGERVEGDGPTYAIHHQQSTRLNPNWVDLPDYSEEDL